MIIQDNLRVLSQRLCSINMDSRYRYFGISLEKLINGDASLNMLLFLKFSWTLSRSCLLYKHRAQSSLTQITDGKQISNKQASQNPTTISNPGLPIEIYQEDREYFLKWVTWMRLQMSLIIKKLSSWDI